MFWQLLCCIIFYNEEQLQWFKDLCSKGICLNSFYTGSIQEIQMRQAVRSEDHDEIAEGKSRKTFSKPTFEVGGYELIN